MASMVKMLFAQVPKAEAVKPAAKSTTKAKPSAAKKQNSLSQDKPHDVSTSAAKNIRERLLAVALTKKRYYANAYHKHVKCDLDDCAFCAHLFHTVNLTRCVGHKPCVSAGWYPHVGPALWQMVRSKHASGQTCRLKPKTCKSYELPALSVHASLVEPQRTPVDHEENSQESFTSNKSTITLQTIAEENPASWYDQSMSVEELYLTAKRKRSASSSQ